MCYSRQNEGSEPRALKLGDLSTKPEYINRKKGLRLELGPKDPCNSCLTVYENQTWKKVARDAIAACVQFFWFAGIRYNKWICKSVGKFCGTCKGFFQVWWQ